jgi:putative transposase
VLNRSAGRTRLFATDEDFLAFQRIIIAALERHPLRLLSYCLMQNHWHFVAWPKKEGELTAFFRWLTHTHAMRWRVAHHNVGYGPLYQGRFKSFPIQKDQHLLTVCRYVERNPLSAGAVERAEQYRWSSLYARGHGEDPMRPLLCDWPVQRRADWVEHVNLPLTRNEQLKIEMSLKRGRPFGSDKWIQTTVQKLDLGHTLRREGRPSGKGDRTANNEHDN